MKTKPLILRQFHKVKGNDFFMNEDFSKQTTDQKKELQKEVKKLGSEGTIDYLNYRTVVIKRINNEG